MSRKESQSSCSSIKHGPYFAAIMQMQKAGTNLDFASHVILQVDARKTKPRHKATFETADCRANRQRKRTKNVATLL